MLDVKLRNGGNCLVEPWLLQYYKSAFSKFCGYKILNDIFRNKYRNAQEWHNFELEWRAQLVRCAKSCIIASKNCWKI